MKNYFSSFKNRKILVRYSSLIVIPSIIALIVYFTMDQLIIPSVLSALMSMLVMVFWKFFKQLIGVSLISILAYIIITFLLLLVVLLLIKYNSSDNIPWDINLFEIFGLNKYI